MVVIPQYGVIFFFGYFSIKLKLRTPLSRPQNPLVNENISYTAKKNW